MVREFLSFLKWFYVFIKIKGLGWVRVIELKMELNFYKYMFGCVCFDNIIL